MAVEPNAINQVAPNGVVDLSGAPGGGFDDATFDKLFPADSNTVVVAPAAQPPATPTGTPAPSTAPQTQPTPQAPSAQPVIKGDRSVYNSLEAATEGINQKDALIEQLRQRYALTTGIDPITGQQIGQAQPQVLDYTQNRSKYMDDLYAAAKQSPEAYVDVQQKFVMDTLGPLQPLIAKYARAQAVETLTQELPDAGKFVGTPVYTNALNANPELKNAIAIAESDVKWHSRLPGLYKLAYLTGQGMQMPELLNKTTVQTPPQNAQVAPRPTAQPTTQGLTQTSAKPSFKTLEGIRAVIADYEGRGHKLDF
jgi:hypothetical protein